MGESVIDYCHSVLRKLPKLLPLAYIAGSVFRSCGKLGFPADKVWIDRYDRREIIFLEDRQCMPVNILIAIVERNEHAFPFSFFSFFKNINVRRKINHIISFFLEIAHLRVELMYRN